MTEAIRNITTYQDTSIELGFEEGWRLSQGLSQLENLETDNFLENLGIMDRGRGH